MITKAILELTRVLERRWAARDTRIRALEQRLSGLERLRARQDAKVASLVRQLDMRDLGQTRLEVAARRVGEALVAHPDRSDAWPLAELQHALLALHIERIEPELLREVRRERIEKKGG